MNLDTFVKSFVCPNTLIRLWNETSTGYKMITGPNNSEVGMEWEIVSGEGYKDWQSEYKDWLVIGVKDILCNTYPEAVNIIIQKEVHNE